MTVKKTTIIALGLATAFCCGLFFNTVTAKEPDTKIDANQPENAMAVAKGESMKLGAFSISLSVKDIKASKQFYENLGFQVLGGGLEKNYLIMKNENCLIGLFQGMFQGNILTFNPGWDESARNVEEFDDVRKIQGLLKGKGIKLTTEADEKTTGPASLMTADPDGNVILIDQHR